MREDDIDTFLAARWSSLFRLACLLTGSPTEADDLLQESLVKVYLRWTKISRTQVPEAYVRRMMVNTLVSRSRRPYKRRELLDGTAAAVAVGSSGERRPGPGPGLAHGVRAAGAAARGHRAPLLRGPLGAGDRRCARLLDREREVPGPRCAGVVETRRRGVGERGRDDERVMITEPELKDVLVRQAESYEVPPHDLTSLRAEALRRRRDTRLRYGGHGGRGAARCRRGLGDSCVPGSRTCGRPTIPSDVTISPSCFPPGVTPPVPDSPWAGGGFLSDQPVPRRRRHPAAGRARSSCTTGSTVSGAGTSAGWPGCTPTDG